MKLKIPFPNFGQTTTAAIAVLVVINAWLCYKGKQLEAENHATKTEIALVQSDNRNLAEQIRLANDSIAHYRQQVKDLHQTVLVKMQQAEKRTNEIMQELEKHSWADEPIPADVERLLKRAESNRALSNHPENAPVMSTDKPLPNSNGTSKNQP